MSELSSAVKLSGQNIVMTPGDYNWEDLPGSPRVITFSGSNNTITLTGVYVNVPVGCVSESYLTLSGDNNTIINGEFEDTYRNGMTEVTDFSAYNQDRDNLAHGLGGDPVLRVEGTGNLVQGLKLTVRGSFPYGYGSIYGIGAGNTFGLNKRCGILINGISNTLDSVEVQQRAMGHAIFMQGDADKTVIKNCLVEGRVRETKEMYTETNAYDLPFLSNYQMPFEDYRALPTDEVHSLCEDGYRMYSIPGSVTIENCVAKKMRGGFRLYLGGDTKVSNCISTDCGLTNYTMRTGSEIINSSGNFTNAPLLSYSSSKSNTDIELTIIPSPNATGPHNIADITSNNNTIIFHRTPGPLVKTDRAIVVTGDGSTIVNETEYTIILESSASGNTITSCGPVTDNGSGNSVTLSDCTFDITCANTPDDIEAECYDDMSGVDKVSINNNNSAVTNIQSGDWVSFKAIDLSGLHAVKAIVGSDVDDAAIEIRVGSTTGDLLATILVPNTGSLSTYEETAEIALDQIVEGAIDVYMVFTGSGTELLNLDEISFFSEHCFNASFDPIYPIEAEDFCDFSGVTVEDISFSNQTVSDINSGDYIVFPNVDFDGHKNYNALAVTAASNSTGGTIEIRSGAEDGTLLMSVEVGNTGSWDTYETFMGNSAMDITGTHDLYFVFTGTADELMKLDNFTFRDDECARSSYQAYNRMEAEDYCDMNGVILYEDYYLGSIQEGDWIRFSNVDFTSTAPLSMKFNVASAGTGGYAQVRLDDPTEGMLITTLEATGTGGWTKWEEFLVRMEKEVTGVHDVYIYFGGGINIDWFQFTDIFVKGPTDPYNRFEAEINDGESGVSHTVTTDVDGNEEVSDIEDGDYVMFSELDLSQAKGVLARVAANEGGIIEVRLGKITGDIIAFIDVTDTGWQTIRTEVNKAEGINDIYFVFKGEGSDLFRLNWLQFTTNDNSSDRLEAEAYDSYEGGFIESASTDDADPQGRILRLIKPGDWVRFAGVDLNAMKSVNARYGVASDDLFIEVRIDAVDGTLIGTIELSNSGGWNNWETAGSSLTEVSAIHDVYFIYQSETSALFGSSNWFEFSDQAYVAPLDPESRIEAEDFTRNSGTVTISTTDMDGEEELSSIQNGDWIMFEQLDLTELSNVDVRVASPNTGSRIELRTGSYDGALLAFVLIPNTGSATNWETVNASLYGSNEGKYNVYFIFKGSSSDLMNINWLQFKKQASAIHSNTNDSGIQLYPNPVKDNISILGASQTNVAIYEINGTLVYQNYLNTDSELIGLEGLARGIYLFKIWNNELLITTKVIKTE